ncbi:MAG: hypothetical protein ACO1NM_06035 [Sphingobium phenoxybenzoativorans]
MTYVHDGKGEMDRAGAIEYFARALIAGFNGDAIPLAQRQSAGARGTARTAWRDIIAAMKRLGGC